MRSVIRADVPAGQESERGGVSQPQVTSSSRWLLKLKGVPLVLTAYLAQPRPHPHLHTTPTWCKVIHNVQQV
jgi:hypothetical protein